MNKNVFSEAKPSSSAFLVKDCALAAIATGERASRLDELRDKLVTIHLGCLYYHFWGARLHSGFAHPDYLNDFSIWAHTGLHDQYLAERLNMVDPNEYEDLNDLRQDLIEIIDDRLDEQESVPVSKREDQFYFIHSTTIVFDTPYWINTPSEFKEVIPSLSTHSIFYHFIEARRRLPGGVDDFSNWLQQVFGEKYQDLIHELKEIDPYFLTLQELKETLTKTFHSYFKGNHV